jgi:hypothetical protein
VTVEPGQILADRFRVERLIGEGGMAVVWLVRHTVLDTPYALKILTITHPSVTERLLREGQVQGQLDHPNVVRVHDVLVVDGHRALLMDYVEGPDLEAWVARENPSLDEKLEVFRGVCAAIAAAHARGLVHRDLKPANVLLAKTPTGWLPKVADFGVAKMAEGEGISKTRTGLAMGTPAFMAPEQIRDSSKVDGRADVFALGCVLYWLATGTVAFDGPDVMTVWLKITEGDYVRPEARTPGLPVPVVRAIESALAVDPDRRLPNVEALLGVLGGATPPPRPARVAPVAKPWMGMAAAGLLTLGLVGAAVVGAGALGLFLWWSDEVTPAEAAVEAPEDDAPAEATGDLDVCRGAKDELIGWARTGKVRLQGNLRKGMTWNVASDVPVSKEIGQPPICKLPAGTVVELVQDTKRIAGAGTYAAVVGGAFDTPGW